MRIGAHKPLCSSIAICRMLDSQGFTEETATAIFRYWKNRSGLTLRQRNQIKRIKKELSEMCTKLTEGEKRVLGRFIGLQKKASFDTGLRIGLAALVARKDVPFENTAELDDYYEGGSKSNGGVDRGVRK